MDLQDLPANAKVHSAWLLAFRDPIDGTMDEALAPVEIMANADGINLYQLWEPETILDQPDRWEITLTVRPDCASSELTTDVTPRRCQQFKAKPGETFRWSLVHPDRGDGATSAAPARDAKPLQEGTATADRWGLVTAEKLDLAKDKRRLALWRSP